MNSTGNAKEVEALKKELNDLRNEKETLNMKLVELSDTWSLIEQEKEKAQLKERELQKTIEVTNAEMRELKERLDDAVETCNESVEVVEVQVQAMEELEEEL